MFVSARKPHCIPHISYRELSNNWTTDTTHFTMAANPDTILREVNILGDLNDQNRHILSKDAAVFLALLHRTFNERRKALLQRRVIRQAELDKGNLLDFLPETKHIRENATWRGAPPAPGLVDRRVEITGPTDRKMVVNALNSNVWTYMADFEGKHPQLKLDMTRS